MRNIYFSLYKAKNIAKQGYYLATSRAEFFAVSVFMVLAISFVGMTLTYPLFIQDNNIENQQLILASVEREAIKEALEEDYQRYIKEQEDGKNVLEDIERVIIEQEIQKEVEEELDTIYFRGGRYRVSYTDTVPITAYSSTVDQTDSTPFITASQTYVRWGIVAANFLPFQTKIRIPDLYGDQIFVVEDRMNKRYYKKIDIWMETRTDAINFGLKRRKIEILEEV